MPTVLLVRPNDFIADAMSALLTHLGLTALRITTPRELELSSLGGVVGAVVSTAVTSAMPMTFREAIDAVRRRSPSVPLVATTMLKDAVKAQQTVELELGDAAHGLRVVPSGAPVPPGQAIVVLRKEEIEHPSPATLAVLRRHFRVVA